MQYEMSELEKKIYQDTEFDLIPPKKVSLLKMKLGKGHRKESDWDIIKEILCSHELLVFKPEKDTEEISSIDGVLTMDGHLFAFTNAADCLDYAKYLCACFGLGSTFEFSAIPFYELAELSEEHQMSLYIDMKMKQNATVLMYHYLNRKLLAYRVSR